MVLALHPNFTHLRRGDNHNGFRQPSGQSRRERHGSGQPTSPLGTPFAVLFKRYKTNGHFGNNARVHSGKTFVESEEAFAFDNTNSRAPGT